MRCVSWRKRLVSAVGVQQLTLSALRQPPSFTSHAASFASDPPCLDCSTVRGSGPRRRRDNLGNLVSSLLRAVPPENVRLASAALCNWNQVGPHGENARGFGDAGMNVHPEGGQFRGTHWQMWPVFVDHSHGQDEQRPVTIEGVNLWPGGRCAERGIRRHRDATKRSQKSL
jgi:hypothetical protein